MQNTSQIGLLYWTIALSEEFIGVNDDSDEENEMYTAAPVLMSSEMRNVTKTMHSYLDAHSNGEMNNKMEDIEQFVDNLMLKNNVKKDIRLFSKSQ
ncbi:hypothetical protein TNCV_1872561 [Trichonephila clavipes]|nr:hypothetical protein TNCV_1872561 [Trichonephila clavipes]